MTSLEVALRRACDDLLATGVPFALVGGLAVSVRTEPRFTRDADLAAAVADDAAAEALIFELRARGYQVEALVEQEAVGRLATARLTVVEDRSAAVLDLLFASSGIEKEIIESAEVLEVLPGLEIPVAHTGHLIALKVLSRNDETRPQDVVDLRALLRAASTDDVSLARRSLDLIAARGYDRGLDLRARFAELRPPSPGG